MNNPKKLLLVDVDDLRRKSRVRLLINSGYAVDVRTDYIEAERLNDEGSYDLVILALHGHPEKALAYSERLSKGTPRLPVLLLTDVGVFVPRDTLNRSIEGGDPANLIHEIADMLAGSRHIRELPVSLK